jgi:uncharacterized membrane protein (DUF373 family)
VEKLLNRFERIIASALIVMMALIVTLATIELAFLIISDLLSSESTLLGINYLLDVFGFFLLVLIGLELLETIHVYLREHVVHVEVVLEVAIIAIARKVIILDVKDLEALTLIGIASIILALAAAFWIIRRTIVPHKES